MVDKEIKLRKQIVACVREVNKRGIWKDHGCKSVRQFCRENMKYGDWDLRSVMMASGVLVQLKDSDPVVQRRIDGLRDWRRAKAEKLKLPLYLIISNFTLLAIAKQNPRTLEMMAEVPGIGERKLELYGRELLAFTGKI
jgi:superfamily II DNA helicase RecQ